MDASVKREIPSIFQKNRIIRNILGVLEEKNDFLIVGHTNPDEDCVAAMVAFGLLVRKFNKRPTLLICTPVQEQFSFLLEICYHNGIVIRDSCNDEHLDFSTVVILDNPKPSMIEPDLELRRLLADPSIRKIEIDHHLEADSRYSGDEGYCLVSEASSTCELIGLMGFKIEQDKELMHRHQIDELFTRNLVLAILTGILGDTKMGKYLKTRRERWYYTWFSDRFERLLIQKTFQGTGNFSSKEDVFQAIAALSADEAACYKYLKDKEIKTKFFRYSVLGWEDSSYLHRTFGSETVAGVAKALADHFAESSGYLGMIAYDDAHEASSFVQFRLRRSQVFTSFDLRSILEKLGIVNGGGHPGAVGFRFERGVVRDIVELASDLVAKIEGFIAVEAYGVS